MLDTPHLYDVPTRIQSRPPRPAARSRQKQRIRNGVSPAALRAVTGARGLLAGQFSTIAVAALSCGSYRGSVTAAVAILKTEDLNLLTSVLAGRRPLLATARSIKHAVELIDAFRKSSSAELRVFGRVITPEKIFDEVVIAAS
jgi:hypothetical protein